MMSQVLDIPNPGWLSAKRPEPTILGIERWDAAAALLVRSRERALHARGGLPGYKLRKVREFIESRIDKPLNLEQIAAAAGFSPFHFHRQFKKATGVTPRQYLEQIRIERAKALLTESELRIVDVALQVGFVDQSHFTTTFRKRTSKTPREFRNAAQLRESFS